ncbi:amidohydrolase family protein [Amycolatopsis jiangsuensis]|uniref:4-oxalmesaconate hydratase n=1 Tax=Amycolatopsis jiangsuensis TaxID=1181879 RepID=A0A840J2L1_9PSEU|nr:amidohydrolase family protein [Amycolatopsis jiangsuensis]MBB4689276.1 4-oxalmesaconate hydratase [Amycolatopsis jiangsuensis]
MSETGAPMYVDCHAHFTSVPHVVKQWRNRQIAEYEQHGRRLSADGLELSDDELAEALSNGPVALQDRHRIELSLLSPIAGLMAHHYGDQETSVVWSRLSNEVIHRACRLFPDRFAGVCQLPQSPRGGIDASVAELRRCVEEFGFVGCNLNPDPSDGHWQAPPITDPYYYPLYAEMVELGVPAMVHASMSANPAVQGTCAHYLNADITVFMQLCQSDLFDRFPDLRLILPHGGGAVPYHWDRYQGVLYDQGRGDLLDIMGDNISFDTCLYGQRGMQLLVDTVPAKNLLFASEMIGAVRGVDPSTGRRYDDTRSLLESTGGLSEVDLAAIASANALRVFPRLARIMDERNA